MAGDAVRTGPVPRLRVVEVVHGLGAGGLERALVERLRHAPPGIETLVLSTCPAVDTLADEVGDAGARVIRLALPGWRARGDLVRRIDSLDADVVVVHTPRNTVQLLGGPNRPTAPVVTVLHNVPASPRRVLEPTLHLVLTRLNPHARLGIAVSERAARGHQASGLPDVVVVYPGVRERTCPVPSTGDGPWPPDVRVRVLVAGRMVAEKRPTLVVDAVAHCARELRRSGVHVVFVGEGPRRAAAEGAARRRGVTDLITFHGQVHRMQPVFEQADVVVIASRYEGGPLTLHEGLVHGCRIVSTDVGVARESLSTDPGHRLLATVTTSAQLAAALIDTTLQGPVLPAEREARCLRHVDRTSARATPAFYATLARVVDAGARVP